MTPRAAGLLALLLVCRTARAAAVAERAAAPAPSPVLAAPVAVVPVAGPALPALDLPASAVTALEPTSPSAFAAAQDPRPTQAAAAQLPSTLISPAIYDGMRGEAPSVPLPELSAAQWIQQGAARAKLLTLRAATLPTQLWPVRRAVNKLSHGEALAGLSPRAAARAAAAVKTEHGSGAVIGRLSWELHDVWSVRGAVRSYLKVVDEIARAKSKDPGLDAALSLDVEALGGQLDGLSLSQRARVARANAELIARRAQAAGIPVEFDVGASAVLPVLLHAARSVAVALDMPVRLALAARYPASVDALRGWAALAAETGLRLGVRLVKGSFIEGDLPGAVNERRPLLERYKRLVTQALGLSRDLDVAVATQNEEIWKHARSEARRLDAPVSFHTIRGVNAPLQERMRTDGGVAREYVSYGPDTPVMALMEAWTNWRQSRALAKRGVRDVD